MSFGIYKFNVERENTRVGVKYYRRFIYTLLSYYSRLYNLN